MALDPVRPGGRDCRHRAGPWGLTAMFLLGGAGIGAREEFVFIWTQPSNPNPPPQRQRVNGGGVANQLASATTVDGPAGIGAAPGGPATATTCPNAPGMLNDRWLLQESLDEHAQARPQVNAGTPGAALYCQCARRFVATGPGVLGGFKLGRSAGWWLFPEGCGDACGCTPALAPTDADNKEKELERRLDTAAPASNTALSPGDPVGESQSETYFREAGLAWPAAAKRTLAKAAAARPEQNQKVQLAWKLEYPVYRSGICATRGCPALVQRGTAHGAEGATGRAPPIPVDDSPPAVPHCQYRFRRRSDALTWTCRISAPYPSTSTPMAHP